MEAFHFFMPLRNKLILMSAKIHLGLKCSLLQSFPPSFSKMIINEAPYILLKYKGEIIE